MQTENTANSFSKIIADLRKGHTLTELSTSLQALVKACRETGKKGKLVLELTVNPTKDSESAIIEDDIKVKEPKIERASTLFYCTDDNLLTRVDPRQEEMRFGVVEETSEDKPAVQAATN